MIVSDLIQFQVIFNSFNVKVVFCSNSTSVVKTAASSKGSRNMSCHVYTKALRHLESMTIVVDVGNLTDKSDDRVGHLKTILVRGGGNLNYPIFKSSNARGFAWKGGM